MTAPRAYQPPQVPPTPAGPHSPPWMPTWASRQLRPPRLRGGYAAHRHPFLTAIGAMFIYCMWAGWVCVLLMVLIYWWIGLGLYLAVDAAVRGVRAARS